MNFRLPSMNKVLIVGNLVAEPIFKITATSIPVINFRIATTKRFKTKEKEQKEQTCFINIVAWAALAETCSKYIHKGDAVFIEGELQSKNWETEQGEKRNSIEILAKRIQFLTKKDHVFKTHESIPIISKDDGDFFVKKQL